jgi:hypothetical protein
VISTFRDLKLAKESPNHLFLLDVRTKEITRMKCVKRIVFRRVRKIAKSDY